MKVLKLVYFAHGWHLALTNRPLIDEAVEAWQFGPVVPSIYHRFKKYRASPIPSPEQELSVGTGLTFEYQTPLIAEQETEWSFIQKIWALYGKLTGGQLSQLTHQPGSPWYVMWNEKGASSRKGTDIPDEMIAAYFKQQLPVQQAAPAVTA